MMRLLSVVRAKAFDTSDDVGRSKERYRRALLTTIASVVARGTQILASLITVPLTLHYLGQDLYGLWLTMSSVTAMFTFADLGIGNGLLTALSEARGRDNRVAARRLVSSGFYVLVGIGAGLGVLFWLLFPLVPWAKVFNVSSPQAAAQVGPAIAILLASFVVALPLGVVSRIRGAFQEGFVDSAYVMFGSVLTIGMLLIAIRLEGGLPLLAGALVGPPIIATLLNGVDLWGRRRLRWLRPRLSDIDREATRRILGVSFFFLILQVAGAVAYQSDAIILAQVLGPASVTQYAIPMKLFLLIPTALGLVFAPLWPAYAEALARGDVSWARRTFSRSMKLAVGLSVPLSLALVFLGPFILDLWVGDAVTPTPLLLLAGGSWAILASIGSAIAAFFNGAHLLKFQAVTAVLMMLANVAISIFLTYRIGVSGVMWGSVIAQIVFMYIPLAFYMRKALGRIYSEVRV